MFYDETPQKELEKSKTIRNKRPAPPFVYIRKRGCAVNPQLLQDDRQVSVCLFVVSLSYHTTHTTQSERRAEKQRGWAALAERVLNFCNMIDRSVFVLRFAFT